MSIFYDGTHIDVIKLYDGKKNHDFWLFLEAENQTVILLSMFVFFIAYAEKHVCVHKWHIFFSRYLCKIKMFLILNNRGELATLLNCSEAKKNMKVFSVSNLERLHLLFNLSLATLSSSIHHLLRSILSWFINPSKNESLLAYRKESSSSWLNQKSNFCP